MRLSVATRKGLFELSQRNGDGMSMRCTLSVSLSRQRCTMTPAVERSPRCAWGTSASSCVVSEDRGKNWEEVASPAYPPKPEGIEDSNPWTLDQVWILEGFHPKHPQRLWAGTNPGGLFRSDDGGRSWQLIESLWNMPERKAVVRRRLRHSGHSFDLRASGRSRTTSLSVSLAAVRGERATAVTPGPSAMACARRSCRPKGS